MHDKRLLPAHRMTAQSAVGEPAPLLPGHHRHYPYRLAYHESSPAERNLVLRALRHCYVGTDAKPAAPLNTPPKYFTSGEHPHRITVTEDHGALIAAETGRRGRPVIGTRVGEPGLGVRQLGQPPAQLLQVFPVDRDTTRRVGGELGGVAFERFHVARLSTKGVVE